MQWLKRLSVLGLLLLPALAVPVGPALATDLQFASGIGRVRPGDAFTSFAFTSFAFTAVTQPDGSSTGFATFSGRLESLTVAIDCLRIGIDVASGDVFVYKTFAIASGKIMDATNNMALIGKTVIFGAIDGDKTIPTPEKDTIGGDFSSDLPSYVTCENSTIAVLHRVVGGDIIIY